MEVEFGKVNDKNGGEYNIRVPASWAEGTENALFIKDFINKAIKVIPITYDRVSILRIKAKRDSIQEIVMAVNLIVQNYKIKTVYSNGICKGDFECFAEFVISRDDSLIGEIMKMKRDRDWLNIEDVMVIHLDEHHRAMKGIMDKIATSENEKESNGIQKTVKTADLLDSYFRMEMTREKLLETLKRKCMLDKNQFIHQLMVEINWAIM